MNISRAQNFTLYIFFFFINFQELQLFNLDFFSIPKLCAFIYLITILPQLTKFIITTEIKSFILPIWLFFGLLTLVSLFNISKEAPSFFDFSLFQNIFLFWFILNHGRKRPRVLEKAMISLAFGSIILALLFEFGIGIELIEGRVFLFGDNSNIIGLRMCISIVILSLAVLQNKLELRKVRYLLVLPIPIMFQLMAETASRVALIAFALCFIGGIFFFQTKRNWKKIVVFAIGIIAFIIIWQFLMQYETLVLRFRQSYEYGDLSGRYQIYESILPVIQKNLIFGIGETGYASLFGEASPHNVFLEVLCYTGSIGLIFYLTFLFIIFRGAYRYTRRTGYLLPSLLLIPILGFLAGGQLLTQKLGWVIFAYIVSCSFEIKRKQNHPSI